MSNRTPPGSKRSRNVFRGVFTGTFLPHGPPGAPGPAGPAGPPGPGSFTGTVILPAGAGTGTLTPEIPMIVGQVLLGGFSMALFGADTVDGDKAIEYLWGRMSAYHFTGGALAAFSVDAVTTKIASTLAAGADLDGATIVSELDGNNVRFRITLAAPLAYDTKWQLVMVMNLG
jgi:hypothetical protein